MAPTNASAAQTGSSPIAQATSAAIAPAGGRATIGASPLPGPSGPSTSTLSSQSPLTGSATSPTAQPDADRYGVRRRPGHGGRLEARRRRAPQRDDLERERPPTNRLAVVARLELVRPGLQPRRGDGALVRGGRRRQQGERARDRRRRAEPTARCMGG